MRLVFDLDGVIATEGDVPVYGDAAGWCYEKCVPVEGAREVLRELHQAGHEIIILTARWHENFAMTLEWLERYGIPFDALHTGKPSGDLYVDDRGYSFTSWRRLVDDIESGAFGPQRG